MVSAWFLLHTSTKTAVFFHQGPLFEFACNCADSFQSFHTQPIFQVRGLKHPGKFGSISKPHFKNSPKIQFWSKTYEKITLIHYKQQI
jgi:hypothetical protein